MQTPKIWDRFVGKPVIVRGYNSGVHIGVFEEMEGQSIVLNNALRIWSWAGALSLTNVAARGIDPNNSTLTAEIAETLITDALEVLPLSEAAIERFNSCKLHVKNVSDEGAGRTFKQVLGLEAA